MPDTSELWSRALELNPQLRAADRAIARARALLNLAYRSWVPDFRVGIGINGAADPVIFRPQVGMSLPIWWDKIAAQIAEADEELARSIKEHEAARLRLAVAFAERLTAYDVARENERYLNSVQIPNTQHIALVYRGTYAAGAPDYERWLQALAQVFELQRQAVQQRAQAQIALTDLELLIAGQMPNHPIFHQIEQLAPGSAEVSVSSRE